jgi:microfibrillar-associated protein 1
MSDESYSGEDEPALDIPLSFVSKASRKTLPADSDSDSDSANVARKQESIRMAKEAISHEPVAATPDSDIFHEPPAPDTNDAAADQDREYGLWVERETQRLRAEITVQARYDLDAANSARRKRMSDHELAGLRTRSAQRRGRMKYMQKYFHRGAYSVDEANPRAAELLQRDFTEPVGADRVDKTLLPESMHVRGGDYQKKGRSKWTHLRAEDTTTEESRREMRGVDGP